MTTYADFVRSLAITEDLIPPTLPTRPRTPLRATHITIHNTDNTSPRADAAAHNRYIRGHHAAHVRKVSWHYTVDDGSIYHHVPINEVAFHAGSGNAVSVAIEICMHPEMDGGKAYERAAGLVAHLALNLKIAIPAKLVQHNHWTGKNCPSLLRAGGAGGWNGFVQLCRTTLSRVASLPGAPGTSSPDPAGIAAARPRRARAARRGTERPSTSDEERAVLASIIAAFADHEGLSTSTHIAKPIPSGNPVPFAVSSAATRHWPLITQHPLAMEINCELANGNSLGSRPGRRFLADRQGVRFHVGLDLFCTQGDAVVAIEDGQIVAFYPFYQGTNALLIAHDGYVVNYGEVEPNSLSSLGLRVGDRVQSGQRIGRVGRLNMLHFETWAPGTKANKPWFKDRQRPAGIRNPSQLLLELVAGSIRLDGNGRAMIAEAATAAPLPAGAAKKRSARRAAPVSTAAIPQSTSSGWHNRFGGREWRYDDRGVHTRDHGEARLWRWEEDLKTMRRIYDLMAGQILAAAVKHGINPALIMMTVATETHFTMQQNFTGPRTFRWEPHVENNDVNPPDLGDYSAGPMQCLATTVRDLIRRKGRAFRLDYQPFVVARHFADQPNPKPATHPLYGYPANIDLGTGEIRSRLATTGDDPILVGAAYNTGGVRAATSGDWKIRAHGDHLDRAAKWYGDACALLAEKGIF